ncbi:MAG: HAMP domain-containing protein [Bacillaceae bacterium]|nr:HAMP domain-containing protein [Bacillaceae bacterium]
MMRQKRTIEKKIMIPFLIVVLLPSLAIGSAAYWTNFQSYKSDQFEQAENKMETVASYLNTLDRQVRQGGLSHEQAEKLAKAFILQMNSLILIDQTRNLDEDVLTAWWSPLLQKENGTFQRNQETIGFEEEWVMIHHFQEWGWSVVIPFSYSYLAEPLIDIQKNTLLVMIIAAIVAVEMTILLSHHISRPIKNLATFCQQLGSGKAEEKGEIPLSRNDEIGVLSRSIKEMIDNLEEKKRLEKKMERIERLAAMGQMASGIAHEIRNPLAGIKTTIQVLASRLQLDKENQSLFEGITGEIDRVNRIISNLLNLARPREPQTRTISAYDVVNQTLVLLEKESEDQHIAFHNRIAKNLYYQVDPDHFKQIIINLSLNAIKAMPGGGEISFSSGEEGEIFVKDDGNGIDGEAIDKIFDPFYTTSPKGTGLGLSMVHQLVLQNNGEIDVLSEQGKGTVFILRFPVVQKEGA